VIVNMALSIAPRDLDVYYRVMPNDPHPNFRANRYYAQQLIKKLTKLGVNQHPRLPLGVPAAACGEARPVRFESAKTLQNSVYRSFAFTPYGGYPLFVYELP
jgi:hypothetical protein